MLDTSLDISAYIHGFRLSIPEVRDRNNASAGAWCLRREVVAAPLGTVAAEGEDVCK